MNDEKFSELWERVKVHYSTYHNEIVEDSYPILYFGDYNAYVNSQPRIVTVGLNPSNNEFPKDNEDLRFPCLDIKSKAMPEFLKAYNDYFRRRDSIGRLIYYNWFNRYENVLNGAKCSFLHKHPNNRAALHTDICTPLATVKKWSKLKKNRRDLMLMDGIKIWHDLVCLLEPNIIICSFTERLLEKIKFHGHKVEWNEKQVFSKGTKKIVKGGKIKINNIITYIYWANQNQAGPFSIFSKTDIALEEIGKLILEDYNEQVGKLG